MLNTIEAEEWLLSFATEKTHIVSAYIPKIGRDHPDDPTPVYQFVVTMDYAGAGRAQLYRHGSRSFDTYDEAVKEMNEYMKGRLNASDR